MSKRSQAKRNARAKEKAAQARREKSKSPLARLVEARGDDPVDCYILGDVEEEALIDILVFRPIRGGGTAVAIFLVDFDCLGIKDAFYRLDLTQTETLETFRNRSAAEGLTLQPISPEKVRPIIAAAVRWSNDHAFSLPPDCHRCLKILGGEIDLETADTSDFGTEDGGLHYIGRRRDLEKRLRGQSIRDFTKQEGVICTFTDKEWDILDEEADAADADFYEDDPDDEDDIDDEDYEASSRAEFDRTLDAMAHNVVRGTRNWCKRTGVPVPAQLKPAAYIYTVAIAQTLAEGLASKLPSRLEDIVQEHIELISREDRADVQAAYEVLRQYLATLPLGTDAGMEEDIEDDEDADANNDADADSGDDDDADADDDDFNPEDAAEVLEESSRMMREKLLAGVRKWCFTNARMPHPDLEEAVRLTLEASTFGLMKAEPESAEAAHAAQQAHDQLLELETPERRAEIQAAMDQVRQYTDSFPTPEALGKALGLDEG